RRIAMLTLSDPALASVSSSLPNALAEKGQVGSRNISKRRFPRPQVSGSARQALIVSVMHSSFGCGAANCPFLNGQPCAPHGTLKDLRPRVGVPRIFLRRSPRSSATRQLLSALRLRQQASAGKANLGGALELAGARASDSTRDMPRSGVACRR